MEDAIKADLFRYGKLSGITGLLKGLTYPGFRFSFFLRKAATHRKNTLKGLVYRLLLRRYTYKYGFQISADLQIGKGLYIGHFGTVIINWRVRIGRNCNLSPGVTIGQENRGERKGSPTIGDYVWIGPNAVIVGHITIGSNTMICPGAFVNFNVPANSLVIGNPGRIIPKLNATEGYINNILEA